MDSRCFCPSENRVPRSRTSVSMPWSSFSTNSQAQAASRASRISSSVASGFTIRMLSAMVPENMVFPWGM